MVMEQNLVILMNKTPYTGRFYRMMCAPVIADTTMWSNIQPIYSCEDPRATILADSVSFSEVGTYTITATYGNYVGEIIIQAIAEPKVSRTKTSITISTFNELKEACERTYLDLRIRFVGSLEVSDEPIYVGEGTIIDFGNRILNYTIKSGVEECALFAFYQSHSGLKNVWLNNLSDPAIERGERHKIIDVENGDNILISNIISQNQWGFGFGVGTIYYYPWAQVDTISHKETRWQATSMTVDAPVGGIESGGIDIDGSLNNDNSCWRTSDYIKCPYCSDDAYIVGTHNINTWPTDAKYANIAFYDADYNLIELQTGIQYWRRYKRPNNAVYWKAFVVQPDAPTNKDTDSNCIFRMFGDVTGWHGDIYRGTERGQQPACVTNLVIDGYICLTNDSGFCSVAGAFNDLNVANVYVESNGLTNLWGFDYEDGWYSMVGAVNIRLYCDSVVACNSGQGLSFHECKTGVFYASHDPIQRTYIGCIFSNFYIRGCVGYQRFINCWRDKTSWNDAYTGVFDSSVMDAKHKQNILEHAAVWKTGRLAGIKQKLIAAGSPITK